MNNAQGHNNGAEGGIGGVMRERDCLNILFVLLRPPADADRSDGCRGRAGDVGDRDFTLPEEFEIVRNESFRQLQGTGLDAFECRFGGLAPLRSTKSRVSAENNPVKDGNMGVRGW